MFESKAASLIGSRTHFEGERYIAPLTANASHLTTQFAKCFYTSIQPAEDDGDDVTVGQLGTTIGAAINKLFGSENNKFSDTLTQCLTKGNIHKGTRVVWTLAPTLDALTIIKYVLQQKAIRKAPALAQPYSGGMTISTIGTPTPTRKRQAMENQEDTDSDAAAEAQQLDFGLTDDKKPKDFEWDLLPDLERTHLQEQHADLHQRKETLQAQIKELEDMINVHLDAARKTKVAEANLQAALAERDATQQAQDETRAELATHVSMLAAEKEQMAAAEASAID